MKYFLLILFSLSTIAATLDVKVDSNEVVEGDSFNLYFTIATESNEEPSISFDPDGVEVLKRIESGVTSRMTYINGRVTRSREMNYIYELVPNKRGRISIRNIQVEIDGQKLKHRDIKLISRDTPAQLRDFFAIAIPSKTTIFKGEPITLRYYLYKRVRVANFDIKKYPKLKGFLKRFMQEPAREERVNYNGEVYIRSVLYTAQLYAEKVGELKIDPIKLKVHYSVSNRQDPFGGFGLGLGFGKIKSKGVSSKPVVITVNPIPGDNVPPHFTGLVGKHAFKFEINKNKFLINEPLEAKLIVDGPGELENFEAPKLFLNPGLEEFEINSDLKINPNFSAVKTFNYTYLTRLGFNENAKKIPLSYFDPEQMKFITDYIELPAISVAGTAAPFAKSGGFSESPKEPGQIDAQADIQRKDIEIGILSPIFSYGRVYTDWIFILNCLLSGLIFILLVLWAISKVTLKKAVKDHVKYWNSIKSGELNYSNLFHILVYLKKEQEQDIYDAISESSLSKKEKNYFLNLLKKLEESQYKTHQEIGIKIEKSYFYSLFKKLKYEDHKKYFRDTQK